MSKQLTFEQALARCLDDLARTGDVEVSLRPYPRWAAQLRPLLEAAQTTQQVYRAVPAPPNDLTAGRARMLAAAAGQRARYGVAPAKPAMASRRLFIPRWAAITLLILMSIIVLGGGIVRAADGSLPGDWLYPVKWTAKDARMALTSDATARAHLAMSFIGERVGEMQALVKTGRPVPDAVVTRMADDVERMLVQAAWTPDADFAGLLTQIAASSRVQVAALEQVRQAASPEIVAGIERAIGVCQQGGEAAAAGLRDPQAFRQRYRHQEGTPAPTASPTAQPLPTSTPWLPTASPTPTAVHTPRSGRTPTVITPTAMPPATPQKPHATATPPGTPQELGPTATPATSSPGTQSTTGAPHTPAPPQSTGESPTPQGQPGNGNPTQSPQGPAATDAPTAPPQGPTADSGSKK